MMLARLLRPERAPEARAALARLGIAVTDSARIGPLLIYALRPPPDADPTSLRASLMATGLFAYAEENVRLQSAAPEIATAPASIPAKRDAPRGLGSFPPNDPLFAEQYALANTGASGGVPGGDIDIRRAWEVTEGDSSVVIAVSEEGFDGKHPDLAGVFVADSAQLAAADNGFWHGTLVAGILAARKGNGEGIAGIAPGCRLMIAHGGYGTTMLAVLKALEKVAQWNAAVYTNSWGFRQLTLQPLQEAYDVVARTTRGGKGTLIVVASGNNGEPWVSYPGWFDRFLAVGATTREDRRWELSNFGRELDLCAPGADIISTAAGGGYTRAWGTSLAAPMVAGTAALIASAAPSLTADSIRAILELTCDKTGGYRFDELRQHGPWSPYVGYGRINAGRAVRMAAGRPDDESRIIWPRGGETFSPGDSIVIRWIGGDGVSVSLNGTNGPSGLFREEGGGEHRQGWRLTHVDRIRLYLYDNVSGLILDSLERPLVVRASAYTVTTDTTAPFTSLEEERAAGRLSTILRGRTVYPLPFDFLFGADTTWAWGADARWIAPYTQAGTGLARSAPLPLDPQIASAGGIAGLMMSDVTGVDSISFGVIGHAPDRVAIFELKGLQVDSALYDTAARAGLASYRRQVRLHEKDGAIGLHYERPFELRPDSPAAAERGALQVGVRVAGETIFPFGPDELRRVPAGGVTITPRAYTPPETPVRSAVISTDPRATYGYDIHRVTSVTNLPEGLAFLRASSDMGATWWTLAQTPAVDGSFTALIPPRFAGTLLLALAGSLDLGWRDTLTVTDHGYTIESLPEHPSAIADDPRASRLVFAPDGTAEIPLLEPVPYFGRMILRLRVHRSGRVEPLFEEGAPEVYAMIKASPRPVGTDPDSMATARLLYLDQGGRAATIVEWDSLARYAPVPEERGPWSAQLRLWSDGVIDVSYRTPASGTVPYYFFPSVAFGEFILISPDFTLRPDFTAPLPLPLGGYRYIPHTPLALVPASTAGSVAEDAPRVLPNPSSGRLTILGPRDGGPWSVEIISSRGQIALARRGDGPTIEIGAGELPPGVWFVRRSGSRHATAVTILR